VEYRAQPEWFHFGGGPFSYYENVGYFLDAEGSIVALRKMGQMEGKWASFRTFLAEELERSEAAYPQFEAASARSTKIANRPWWRLYRWLRERPGT
jgi:hypothetical protein